MSTPTTSRRGRGRPPGPAVDRAARTEALLDAAESTIRATGPDPSLDAIATEAGFARSAVYAAFPDKSSVFRALAERHARRLTDTIAGHVAAQTEPQDWLVSFIDDLAGWAADDPELYRALGRARDHDGLFAVLSERLERVLALNLADADADRAGPWSRAIMGATEGLVDWWIDHPSMPRSDLVQHTVALFWDGASALPAGVLQLDLPTSDPLTP